MGIFSRNELNKAIQEAGAFNKFVLHQNIKEVKRMADDAIKSGSVERMEFANKRALHLLYQCEKGSSEMKKVQEIIDRLDDAIEKK